MDLYNGSGSVFLGYGYPDFISSLRHCIDQNLIPRQSELEWETAQYLAEAIPCCEQVRFGLSGTEMVTNALRLARAFTGREIIIRFQGHYHGSSDSMLPNNIKNRTSQNSTVIELPWNDADKLESCLRNYPVAAIIMEPICINGWGIEPLAGYLEKHANYATGSVPCLFSMRLLPGSERDWVEYKKHVCYTRSQPVWQKHRKWYTDNRFGRQTVDYELIRKKAVGARRYL